MHRFPRHYLLSTALMAMTLLAVSLGQRFSNPAPELRSLDHWDIPELADHLNRAGVQLRLCSPQKNGTIAQTAFLTATDKGWDDLNPLIKHPSRLPTWRGTVYCERAVGRDAAELVALWSDPCLVVGPFVFYGDAKLLERIHTVLAPFESSAAP
jgi:hypothetical protein